MSYRKLNMESHLKFVASYITSIADKRVVYKESLIIWITQKGKPGFTFLC